MSLLREFLNQVDEGYLLLDKDGKVIFCNQFVLKRQLVKDNCEGKPFYECINNLTAISCVAQTFSQRERGICEFYQGDRVYSLYVFSGGELTVVRFTDITDLKRYERSKKEFVANVSHELKTPISVIKSILETLYEEEDREEKKQFIKKALRRVEDMQRLVEDLLIITKLESGEEKLNKQIVFLKPLVDEVFELFATNADKKGIKLENLVEENFTLYADEEKLFLLLKNLIDNAINYNKADGWVRVSANIEEPYSVIVVEDSGIGIPKEHLPFIFERFYRVDQSRSRELGGTGLGLSIVKHIALSHGGRVEVESQEGSGSTFKVYLPLK